MDSSKIPSLLQDVEVHQALQELFEAIRIDDADRLDELVNIRKLPVNLQDSNGMTPLHFACAEGAYGCARVLIDSHVCDHLIVDKRGRYASSIALKWGARDPFRRYALAEELAHFEIIQARLTGAKPW